MMDFAFWFLLIIGATALSTGVLFVEPITLPGTSRSQGTLRCETGCPLRSQEEPTGMSRRSVSPAKPAAVPAKSQQTQASERVGFFRRLIRKARGG